MYLVYAVVSAVFAGLMTVLSKIGIKHSDSDTVTVARTFFVLVTVFLFALFFGVLPKFHGISPTSFALLIWSGVFTGVSWVCYFRSLDICSPNTVASIDKFATVITAVSAIILFHETDSLAFKIVGILLILAGTGVMAKNSQNTPKSTKEGIFYAFAAAITAGISSVVSKIGVTDVDSTVASLIRTVAVFVISLFVLVSKGKTAQIKSIPKKDMLFIFLSALATAGGWLCFYKALSIGDASTVVSVHKSGLVFTAIFSFLFLHEKPDKKQFISILLITFGTVSMMI